jgi:hypothetical protein
MLHGATGELKIFSSGQLTPNNSVNVRSVSLKPRCARVAGDRELRSFDL